MNVKKSIAIVLALLTVGQVSVSKAYENTNDISQVNISEELKEITDENNKVMPREATYLNESFGGTHYSKIFNAHRKEGNILNVNIQNNGKTNVDYSLYKGSSKIQTVTVLPGSSKTVTVKNSFGVSGTFKVIVSTNDGSRMSLYVRARQFDGN